MINRKILFTDLDGTLLDSKKQISRRTYDVLDNFTKAGNLLALSSGRDINSIGNVKEDLRLNFPGMFLIGYNGGQIFDCTAKKTIYRNALKKEQAVSIIETALQMGIHCHTYSETHIITPANGKEFEYYLRAIKTPVIYATDLALAITEEPGKCIAIELDDKTKLEKLRAKILNTYDNITSLFSSPVYLEFFPASSGKGSALIKLCEILNIPLADSIAAGDQENDLSMLKAAGTSIAMCNGMEALKETADIVTEKDNNCDGLAEVLVYYI